MRDYSFFVKFIKGNNVKLLNLVTAGVLATSLVSPLVNADQTVAALTDAQKKEMQQLIHDYLVKNPEVLLEASQALQQKQQQDAQVQAQVAIKDNSSQLFQDKLATVGNPKGNVTLVEFFDYQCIHCQKMSPVIDSIVKKDSDVRVVYKEFPIFGKSSEVASRAALAAGMQGKYQAMHNALFKIDKRLDEELIMNAAKSIGLDMAKLKKDMDSKEVSGILAANRQLAEKLHLMGTPAFIVGATPNGQFKQGSQAAFVPGAASEDALQKMIKEAAGS